MTGGFISTTFQLLGLPIPEDPFLRFSILHLPTYPGGRYVAR